MTEDREEPPSRTAPSTEYSSEGAPKDISTKPALQNGNGEKAGIMRWLKSSLKNHKHDSSLRETIEEFIEESNSNSEEEDTIASFHEKTLISNVLKLRDTPVVDAMIPRADIIAIEAEASKEDLFNLLSENTFSRIPVYNEKLDDVLGTIHIKDILAALAQNHDVVISDLIREVPIIAPSMNVLDLLMEMRQTRKHMAMVVDEFGGIDGLVTIGDIIEEIVGHLEDEHDTDITPQIIQHDDGSIVADARYDIDEFEDEYGQVLGDEERDESDTLGGLIFHMAGRVPSRGEVLTHDSGMVFEILDADPRRVNRIKISHIPESSDLRES